MAILVYGMNHASAPLAVREKAAFLPEETAPAAARLAGAAGVEEALILSTCNRTELLVSAEAGGAEGTLKEFLAAERRVTRPELETHCYLRSGRDAVRHVFRTASSLDSLVVGEAQILGQVKEAYSAALLAGAVGTALEGLMQRCFAVARKVRAETGLGRSPVSVGSVAAGLARGIAGDLDRHTVMILGAGEMARLTARRLIGGGVREVVVANRSFERGDELARQLGGRAIPFARMLEEMERVDIVIASTAAPHHVVRFEDAQGLSRARHGRPLFFIDIAVPRDIDPRIHRIDNIYLYDIDDLQGVVRAGLDGRRQETAAAETIVEREVEAYLAWLNALAVAPTIVDLRRRIHDIGAEELSRLRGRLGPLSPEQESVLGELVTSLINKFLHPPTVALKRAAARGSGLRVRLLRELFGLDAGRGAVADHEDSGRAGAEDEIEAQPREGAIPAGRPARKGR
jgi:glutamyl-tRNA reductase